MNALIPWGELEEEEKIDLTDQKAGEKQKYTLNSFEIPPLYEPPLSHKHSKKEYIYFYKYFLNLKIYFNSLI